MAHLLIKNGFHSNYHAAKEVAMKTKITRRGVITLLVIAVLISLAVFYNARYGRMFNSMSIGSSLGSSKEHLNKPDIWFENFFGGKKNSDPRDIRR